MAARYSYDPLAQYQYQQMDTFQSGPRRFASAVGRFFYRLIVLTLILGAVGGILFALYRNDILLTIARGAGVEAQYRAFEKRIGAPGWGTPRSIDLPKDSAAALPVAEAAPATTAGRDAPPKQPETVQAAATNEAKSATADGLPIVSFDSLPTLPAKSSPQTASLNSVPNVEPAKPARAEPAPARSRAPQRTAKAEKKEPAKPVEVTRSIPLPKAPPKPEPVAKAEPEPKPEPPAPKVQEDHTTPRAGDNPLKAAIRAQMAAKSK